jgi:hypothetical protein
MLNTKIQLKDRYVRDFVVTRYGNGNTNIKIDRRSLLGKVVELGCSKIGYLHCLPKQPTFREDHCVTLELPDAMKNDFIHPAKTFIVADVLTRHFYEMFMVEMEVLIEGGLSDYDAVAHYMKKYGIEDNVKMKENGKIDEKLRKKWRDRQHNLRKMFEKEHENKVG